MKQSPIEFLFLELVNHSELAAYSPQPQYRVGSYTLDLALAGPRIAVENQGREAGSLPRRRGVARPPLHRLRGRRRSGAVRLRTVPHRPQA
jgi:hypothetical protein